MNGENQSVKESEAERLFLIAVRRWLTRARTEALTGEGTIKVSFHQGGITGKKFGLEWKE